jgi:nucleoside-diphosphate-sugar epimerase
MKVLLTGHAGYIGTVLAPMLLARGHDVVGCDTDLFRRCTYGADPLALPNLGLDVRDLRTRHLAGFDAIIHLAGLSNDPLGDLDPQLTIAVNAAASFALASAAREAGVARFVFSSSCSSYGAAPGDDFLDETAPLRPATPYGRSKVLSEELITTLADDEFTPVFLRNATVYGASPRLRFDLVVNNLTAWAFAEKLVYLKSDGMAWRPLVHVEDVCRAFVTVLEAPREKVHNDCFNIGQTEENYRVRDVAQIVGEELPEAKIQFGEGAGADIRNYRVDCSKFFARFPDVRFAWDVRSGVRQLIEVFTENGLGVDHFEGARYQRIAHLRMLMEKELVRPDLRPATLPTAVAV